MSIDALAKAYVFPADATAAAAIHALGISGTATAVAGTAGLRDVIAAAAKRGHRIDCFAYVATADISEALEGANAASRLLLRHPHGIAPALGRRLKELKRRGLPWDVRVAADPLGAALHAKIYVVHLDDVQRLCIVGSSNATGNGLARNLETNIAMVCSAASASESPSALFDAIWDASVPWDPRVHDPSEYLAPTALGLFGFQDEALRALEPLAKALDDHDPSVGEKVPGFLVSLPTGGGKTLVAARFVLSRALPSSNPKQPRRVLWLAGTVEQRSHAAKTLRREMTRDPGAGLNVCEIDDDYAKGDIGRLLNDNNVVFVTEQLLASRVGKRGGDEITPFDLVVIDEAHHVHTRNDRYPKILGEVRHRARLGITATPYRTSTDEKAGLYAYFNPKPSKAAVLKPVFWRKLSELWDVEHHGQRVFADPQVEYLPTNFKVDLAKVRTDRDLKGEAFKDKRRTDKIAAAFDPAGDGPAIFFAVDVADANAITTSLLARGVRAQAVHTGTPVRGSLYDKKTALTGLERRTAVDRLGDPGGNLDAIVSVDVFIEGVDVPRLRSVFLARPTESPRVYLQMVGRAMRGPAAGGTETARVVHFADDYAHNRYFHPLRFEDAIEKEEGRPLNAREKSRLAATPVGLPSGDELAKAIITVLDEASEPLTLRGVARKLTAGRPISESQASASLKRCLVVLDALVAERRARRVFLDAKNENGWQRVVRARGSTTTPR